MARPQIEPGGPSLVGALFAVPARSFDLAGRYGVKAATQAPEASRAPGADGFIPDRQRAADLPINDGRRRSATDIARTTA